MIIIFSSLVCLFGLAASLYLSSGSYKAEKGPLHNRLERMQEGIRSYNKWQFSTFPFYLLLFLILIMLLHYAFFHSIAVQVPVSFLLGIVVSVCIYFVSVNLSVRTQQRLLLSETKHDLYFPSFRGSASVGLMSISCGFLGVLITYTFLGSFSLIYYAFGSCLVVFFTQINGSIFAKAAGISSHIVRRDNSKILENDSRNPSSWGEKVGGCTVSAGGRVSGFMLSYVLSVIGAIMIVHQLIALGLLSESSAVRFVNYIMILCSIGIVSIMLGLFISLYWRGSSSLNRMIWGIYLTIALTAAIILIVNIQFPFSILPGIHLFNRYVVFWAVLLGLIGAIIVSIISEYYSSGLNKPVKDIADKSQYSPANTILGGIRMGMKSMFIPIISIGILIYLANKIGGIYAIGMTGVGMLSIIGSIVAVNVFSSTIGNTRMIREMYPPVSGGLSDYRRLDSYGDTLHGVSIGYSSIASFLSSLILLLVLGLQLAEPLSIPYEFVAVFVIIGSFVPFLFAYFIIKGINHTSIDASQQAIEQLNHIPYLKEGKTDPDIAKHVKSLVQKSQLYTFTPATISLLFPLVIGVLYGRNILFIFLLGALVSGLLLTVIFTNTGSLLYNVKKYIEAGNYGGIDTQTYQSAVIGDMIGNPIKDAIAPSLDILIKVMLIFALIISPLFI